MKKNDIDKILEEQRKNLRFVGDGEKTDKPAKKSRFVTVDDAPKIVPKKEKLEEVEAIAAKAAVKKSASVGTYVDIRKLKLERSRLAKEQEQQAEQIEEDVEPKIDLPDDGDRFGIDYVLNKQKTAIDNARAKADGESKKIDPIGSRAAAYKFLANEPTVPEPAAVRTKRLSAKRKVDEDLVDKKILNTYFDDLLD